MQTIHIRGSRSLTGIFLVVLVAALSWSLIFIRPTARAHYDQAGSSARQASAKATSGPTVVRALTPNQFGARISRSSALAQPDFQVTDNLPPGLNFAVANVDTPISYTGSVPPSFTGSFNTGIRPTTVR